jgi:hypothetical protein
LNVHALPGPYQPRGGSGILIGNLSSAVLPVLPVSHVHLRVTAVLVDYLSRGSGRTITLIVVVGISGGPGDSRPPASSEEPGVLDDGSMLVHKGLIGFIS